MVDEIELPAAEQWRKIVRKRPLLPTRGICRPVAVSELRENRERDVRMAVAREEHQPRLAGDASVRALPHLLDRDLDQLFDIVVNPSPVLPDEIPSAAFAVVAPVAGEEFVVREQMQEMPRVHHVLAIARIGSPRLLAPVVLRHRIRPDVSSQNALDAVAEHFANPRFYLRVAAHPHRGRGVSGEGDVVALREDSVLRSTDVPPFALLFVRKRTSDVLKPGESGKLVIGKRQDARRIRRVR